MKEILFSTNFASPYRVDFWNYLGKYCNLTVAYERRKALHRNADWVGDSAQTFTEIYLKTKPIGTSQSRGTALVQLIRHGKFDIIIFSGYASPTVQSAICYCKKKKLPYYIEYDGGFDKKEIFVKNFYKKHLLRSARGHFISCFELEKYLSRLGVPEDRLLYYPFTSLRKMDILNSPTGFEKKQQLKDVLGIRSDCAILTVGQFIPRKGFDILLNAASIVKNDCDIYIIGGEPTDDYLQMKEELGLHQVHFVGFMSKEKLKSWYRACDIFVLPTREDIWGLVVNEAMANGLPVISTDRCIAALELIKVEENGYIVPAENVTALAEKMDILIKNSALRDQMGKANLEKIQAYTIENMVEAHISHLKRIDNL